MFNLKTIHRLFMERDLNLFTAGEGNCFVFIYEWSRLCSIELSCVLRVAPSCFAEQDLNPISRKLMDRGKFKELFSEAFEFHISQKSNARADSS